MGGCAVRAEPGSAEDALKLEQYFELHRTLPLRDAGSGAFDLALTTGR